MPETAPKKMLILAVLEVLRTHTDEEHRLHQPTLLDLVREDHGITCDRKSLRRNLASLQEAGYPIEFDSGWYYVHEFHSSELNLIIDSLLCNPAVTAKQSRSLIERLSALGGRHYAPAAVGGILRPNNPQFLYTLNTLHECIDRRHKVEFHYGRYDVDKKVHVSLNKAGNKRVFCVSPYRIAQSGGRYYLIAHLDETEGLRHYRLDKILDVTPTRRTITPLRDVEGGSSLLNMPRYLAEHPHMFSGEPRVFGIRAKRQIAGDILDWFGTETQMTAVDEDTLIARVCSDELSFHYWLLQYGEHAEQCYLGED